jgi:hypothetical protein
MIRALPLFLLLTACADFPEVGRAEAALVNPGDTPALLTSDEMAALSVTAPDRSAALAGEAAALRNRARHLRQR